jgi:hypothetical protein
MVARFVPERKMFTVLHLDYYNPPKGLLLAATVRGSFKAVVELYNMGYYRKVASVLCESLEGAVVLTQEDWKGNPGVVPVEEIGESRSTTIGDILVTDDQEAFSISKTGFEPLPLILRADHRTIAHT